MESGICLLLPDSSVLSGGSYSGWQVLLSSSITLLGTVVKNLPANAGDLRDVDSTAG